MRNIAGINEKNRKRLESLNRFGKNIFSVKDKTKQGDREYSVTRLSAIGIRRHIKIRASANPYTQEDAYYFWRRRHKKESRLLPALGSKACQLQWA